MLKKPSRRLFQEIDLKVLLLILLGTISWSITMVKSGLIYSFGAGFWGANGHDGVWHLALSQSIASDLFSGAWWKMPIFAGQLLKNYHIGFDSILAVLHLLTHVSVSTLYFQIIPPILAFLTGLYCWIFVFLWKNDKAKAFWATFFVYFGGSFGWIVTLLRESKLGGESIFWSQQSISTLINPPFALSLGFLLSGLILIILSFNPNNKKQNLTGFIAMCLFGFLIIIKVYAGLLGLTALLTSGIYLYLKRRELKILKVFVGAMMLSVLLFFFTTSKSGSLIVFKPFWFLETMLGLSDRFHWPKLYEALMNYKLGRVWYKLIPAYLTALGIFLVGNLGTRIIAVKYFFEKLKDIKNINSIDVFVVTIISAGVVVPLLFLQTGTPWNTIQFFYYSLFFAGILAGISLANAKKWVIICVVLLTIPTTIATLKNDYLPSRPPAKISHEELQSLEFLKKQEKGVVLTYNYDEHKAKEAVNNPPRPLYLYESTAYVSAYADKQVYLEDQVNLDITGYNWRERREKADTFFKTVDEDSANLFLKENNIRYLYLVKALSPNPGELLRVGKSDLGLVQIYDNSEVAIFLHP